MDGTLIEAWASIKSFREINEEPSGDDGGSGDETHGRRAQLAPRLPLLIGVGR